MKTSSVFLVLVLLLAISVISLAVLEFGYNDIVNNPSRVVAAITPNFIAHSLAVSNSGAAVKPESNIETSSKISFNPTTRSTRSSNKPRSNNLIESSLASENQYLFNNIIVRTTPGEAMIR